MKYSVFLKCQKMLLKFMQPQIAIFFCIILAISFIELKQSEPYLRTKVHILGMTRNNKTQTKKLHWLFLFHLLTSFFPFNFVIYRT